MKNISELEKEKIKRDGLSVGIIGSGGYFGRFYTNIIGEIKKDDPSLDISFIAETSPLQKDGKPNEKLFWSLDRLFSNINPEERDDKKILYYADFIDFSQEEIDAFNKNGFNWTKKNANIYRFGNRNCEINGIPVIKDIEKNPDIAETADLIFIVTPTPTHYNIAKFFGELGVKMAFDDVTPNWLAVMRDMKNIAPEKPPTQTPNQFKELLTKYRKITTDPIESFSPEMQALFNLGKNIRAQLIYSAHYRESEINKKLEEDPGRSISDDPWGDKKPHDFSNMCIFLENVQGYVGDMELIESKISGFHIRKRPGEEDCLVDRNEFPEEKITYETATADGELKIKIKNYGYEAITDIRSSWDGIPKKLEEKISRFLGPIYPKQGDELRTAFWVMKPRSEDNYILGITNTMPPKVNKEIPRYLVVMRGEKIDDVQPRKIDDIIGKKPVFNWDKENAVNVSLDGYEGNSLKQYISQTIRWAKGEGNPPISPEMILSELDILSEARKKAIQNYIQNPVNYEKYIEMGLVDDIKL